MTGHLLDLLLFPSARRRRRAARRWQRVLRDAGITGADWRVGYFTRDRTDLPYPSESRRLARQAELDAAIERHPAGRRRPPAAG